MLKHLRLYKRFVKEWSVNDHVNREGINALAFMY